MPPWYCSAKCSSANEAGNTGASKPRLAAYLFSGGHRVNQVSSRLRRPWMTEVQAGCGLTCQAVGMPMSVAVMIPPVMELAQWRRIMQAAPPACPGRGRIPADRTWVSQQPQPSLSRFPIDGAQATALPSGARLDGGERDAEAPVRGLASPTLQPCAPEERHGRKWISVKRRAKTPARGLCPSTLPLQDVVFNQNS